MGSYVRGSVLLLSYGGFASATAVWHGPTSLIWHACPELVPGHSFGSNTSTAAQCQALATLHGANTLNYNTDPSISSGPRCQLRNCSTPIAPAWKVPFWVGYATFAVPPPPPPAPPKPGQLSRVTLVEAAARDGAVCLDGSPPVYYWRAGSGSGAKSWVLFLEGGGWCAGLGTAVGGFDSCLARSKGGLGSSHSYGPTMNLGEGAALWSADSRVNPRFWNWNVAYAKYCDGASFSGNASLPANASGSPLYFRGARILAAIVANVTAPTTMGGKGMVTGGSDGAILSGCSAGGLATYLHCDAFAELVAPTPTKCVADAGYFANIPSAFGQPKIPNPRGSIIEYEYTWVFTNQQSHNSHIGVNQNCLAALGHDNPLCFFPEFSLQHMTTPMFVLQSGYDSWQTNFIWFTPDGGKPTDAGWHGCAQFISKCNTSQLALMATYHDKFVNKLAPLVNASTPHGGYVDSCMAHCQSGGVQPPYNNRTSMQTVADWFDGKYAAKAIDLPYPHGTCK